MTIREAQELIRFRNEKEQTGKYLPVETKDELCRRFISLLLIANNSNVDLTEVLVDSLGEWK